MNNGFNIICRNGKYYFRARIPAKLVSKVGIREIKKSLNTNSLVEAKKRAGPLQAFFSELKIMSDMDDILRQLSQSGINTDQLTHKIKRISIGNLLIEGLEVDPDNKSDVEAAEKVIRAAAGSQPAHTSINQLPPLKKGITAYIDEQVTAELWRDRTEAENRAMYNLFLQIVGENITGDQFTFDTARKVKETLVKLPAGYNKAAKYKGKSIDEILKIGGDPRASSTINKALVRYSSLFTFLVNNGYVTKNFFEGMSIKQKKSVKDERRIFSAAELQNIFQYCANLKRPQNYQQWIPSIALYAGLRLEEICQLHCSDIKRTDEGTWYFDINDDDDKQLKNKAAKRLVPIHSVILNAGFLEFVNEATPKHKHLFKELIRQSGRRGHYAGKWFGALRSKLDIVKKKGEPAVDFHSFRHNMMTQLTHKDVPEYAVAGLVGHSWGETDVGERYAKSLLPDNSIKHIELLDFDIPFPN